MWAAVLRAAVWRVFRPGCQFDFVLTLKGAQGILKSSSFQALVPDPDWFSSSTHDQSKDMTVALHRVLITGLAELEHITGKRSTGALKTTSPPGQTSVVCLMGGPMSALRDVQSWSPPSMVMSSSRTKRVIAGFGLLMSVGMSSTPTS